MPKGLIVMEWNERSGAEITARYPENLEVDNKTLTQIYAAHNYEAASGIVSLMVGPLNLLSYYTGEDSGYYIVLLLGLEEEGELYEDALIDAGRIILSGLAQKTLNLILSSIFTRISNYHALESSQLYAMLYQNDVKRKIMARLEKEGYLSQSEMKIWITEEFGMEFVDLDSEIMSLVKHGFVKEGTVKGLPSQIVYLMNVLFVSRVPAVNILKEGRARGMPDSMVDEYKNTCKEFFSNYVPTEEDNLKICEIISEIPNYEVIKLLRQSVVTKETLEKLKKKGVEDVQKTLKTLIDADIVMVLHDDSGTGYYMLKSDIRVQRVFPEYVINVARHGHNERTKSSLVLVEHMRLLKEAYLESLKVQSSK